MAHRRTQIMGGLESRLTGLSLTGGNIFRSRSRPLEASNLPAIGLYQGGEVPQDPQFVGVRFMDREFTAKIIIWAEASDEESVELLLDAVEVDIHKAVQGDPQLGFTFVQDTVKQEVNEPEIDGEVSKPAGTREIAYRIQYRHDIDNPEI